MKESLLDMTVREFSQRLASNAPVPGGGGASALTAALAAALGLMVGNLTLGKKKYEANEPELKKLMAEAEELRNNLNAMIDADAEAFAPLSEVYSMPKDAPGRDEIMEKCLKAAADVPMNILRLSCRCAELMAGFKELGSVLAVSDAGTAAAFCKGAMEGAALNVLVNTKLMKNRETADEMNREVEERLSKYLPLAEAVYSGVYEGLFSSGKN